LFTGTIKNNLLIAKPDASDEELSAAIRKAELEEFINKLPEKLNTSIGELGKKLSGGESKRLTIARAFLKDYEIIIFDEALSHVDSLTESLILNSVQSIPSSKTVLFITHKLNRMEMFDKILVIKNGRLIDSGTHIELLEQNSFYKRLFELQNNK
jgi:ABC-type multidrug transport system fused ATPase/permease subunit